MIKPLLATFALAVITQPCLAATQGSYLSVHHEQRGGNRASGISFTAYNRGLALGVSANKLTSNQPLELQDRNTIYPVYAFAKLALRTPIAPYIEVGVDLGDYFLYETANDSSNTQNGTEGAKAGNVDAYGAIGIKTSMRRAPIDFAVYVKSYALTFNDVYRQSAQGSAGTVLTMSGANIIFNF